MHYEDMPKLYVGVVYIFETGGTNNPPMRPNLCFRK
jgi:hypothetical protein